MESPIEQIKNKLDIIEVVQSYVRLDKAGMNWRASCPFHQEKTPSFFVSPTRQTWRCFGCGKGGDMFTFVQEIESIEFIDALRLLAEKAGVTLKRQASTFKTERARLLEILEQATRFFEKQLEEGSRGQEALKYLSKRGLKPETINTFRLGWAPQSFDALSQFLSRQGYTAEEILRAGLAVKSISPSVHQSNNLRDRFRGRIIFPLFDTHGKTLGFTGRIFGREERDQDPKYLNSPETPVFEKGKILYGFHTAKIAVRKEGFIVLVEGQMDFLLSYQVGVVNTIATSGTALTQWQLQVLRRHVDTLVTAFDTDRAGEQATQRGIDLALQEGFNVRVVPIEGGKDPAEIILRNSDAWSTNLRDNQRSILDFYFSLAFAKHDATLPEGKRRIVDMLLPILKKVGHAIEQAHWVSELASRIKIKEEQVWEALGRYRASVPSTSFSQPTPQDTLASDQDRVRWRLLEEEILLMLLASRETAKTIPGLKELMPHWTSASGARLLEHLLGESSDSEALPEEIRPLFDELSLRKDISFPEEDAEHIPERMRIGVRELGAIILRDKLSRLADEIQEAEGRHDHERTAELLEEFRLNSQRLSDLLNPAPQAL